MRTFDIFTASLVKLPGPLQANSTVEALALAKKMYPHRSGLMVEDLDAKSRRVEDESRSIQFGYDTAY